MHVVSGGVPGPADVADEQHTVVMEDVCSGWVETPSAQLRDQIISLRQVLLQKASIDDHPAVGVVAAGPFGIVMQGLDSRREHHDLKKIACARALARGLLGGQPGSHSSHIHSQLLSSQMNALPTAASGGVT